MSCHGETTADICSAVISALLAGHAPRRTISTTAAAIIRARMMAAKQEEDVAKANLKPGDTTKPEEHSQEGGVESEWRLRLRERRKRARANKKERIAKAKNSAPKGMEVDDSAQLVIQDSDVSQPKHAQAKRTLSAASSSMAAPSLPPVAKITKKGSYGDDKKLLLEELQEVRRYCRLAKDHIKQHGMYGVEQDLLKTKRTRLVELEKLTSGR